MTDREDVPDQERSSCRQVHADKYRHPGDIPRISGWLRVSCVALVAVALVIYGLGFPRGWRIGMDQAFYTSIARSVATGQGYTFCGKTQMSVPPVTPLYIAAGYRFGHLLRPEISLLDMFVYLNAFMLIAGLAGLLTAFLLMRELTFAPAPPGNGMPRLPIPPADSVRRVDVSPMARVIIATVLLVFCSRYYDLSMEMMTDVPYCLISWIGLLFVFRSLRAAPGSDPYRPRWGADLVLAAFCLALAPFTRLAGMVLLGNVAALFVFQTVRAKVGRRDALIGLAALVPAFVASAAMLTSIWLGRNEGTFNYLSGERGALDAASFDQLLHRWLVDWPSNLAEIPARLFGVFSGRTSTAGLGLIVFAVVAIGAAKRWRRGQRFGVLYCASSLVLTSAVTVPQTRYFLPLLPFIFLFAVDGVLIVAGWAASGILRVARGGRIAALAGAMPAVALIGLLVLTVAANSLKINRTISLSFSDDFYRYYQKGEYYDYLALTQDLASAPPAGAVMAREFRVVFALSSVPVCPPFPGRTPDTLSIDEAAEYVRDRSVAAIVVDPRHADAATAFMEFITRGPFRWRVAGTYGALTVYARVP